MDNINIGDIMSRVKENPELMNSLKATAESLFGSISTEESSSEKSSAQEEGANQNSQNSASVLDVKDEKRDTTESKSIENEQRVQLLLALKPYMDEDRREKIDYMLRIMRLLQISEIGSLIKNFL